MAFETEVQQWNSMESTLIDLNAQWAAKVAAVDVSLKATQEWNRQAGVSAATAATNANKPPPVTPPTGGGTIGNSTLMSDPVYPSGVFDGGKYTEVANLMGTERGVQYLFGPGASFYGVTDASLPLLHRHADMNMDIVAADNPANAHIPRNKLRGCAYGQNKCGTAQLGDPSPGEGGMYSSSMGPGMFVPDNRQANPYGIGMTDFVTMGVGEDTFQMRPEPFWGYYTDPPDTRNQLRYRNQGKDVSYPVAMARGEGRPGWGISAIAVTRGGLVTSNGQSTGNNQATLQLEANMIPTAVTVTNSHEFALITVWDTVNKRGRVAVIGLAGTPNDGYLGNESNWGNWRGEWRGVYPGLPSFGNISFMKFMGYIELPSTMKCPTGIAATLAHSFWDYQPFEGSFNLNDAGTRQRLRDGDRNWITPRQGVAVVISKEERKACFIDLGPLMRKMRDIYYGTSAPPSVATGTFPPTFTQSPDQMPTIIKTVDLTDRPTAVKCSMYNNNKRCYIATQTGVLRIWDLGNYPNPGAGNPATIVEKGTVAIGRNPTCIAVVKRKAGGNGFGDKVYPNAEHDREVIVNCRGDRNVQWVRMAADYNSGSVVRVCRDRRMVDPVWVEDNDNHTTESYVITVSDFAGKQYVNYRYGPVIFWSHKGEMADDPNNVLSFDWHTSLPPDGTPVTTVTWNGQVQPFECGGTYPIPGKPFCTATANVF